MSSNVIAKMASTIHQMKVRGDLWVDGQIEGVLFNGNIYFMNYQLFTRKSTMVLLS